MGCWRLLLLAFMHDNRVKTRYGTAKVLLLSPGSDGADVSGKRRAGTRVRGGEKSVRYRRTGGCGAGPFCWTDESPGTFFGPLTTFGCWALQRWLTESEMLRKKPRRAGGQAGQGKTSERQSRPLRV